jgi:hypothetical protein
MELILLNREIIHNAEFTHSRLEDEKHSEFHDGLVAFILNYYYYFIIRFHYSA